MPAPVPRPAKAARVVAAPGKEHEEGDEDDFQDAGAVMGGSDADASQGSHEGSHADDHEVHVEHFDKEEMERALQYGTQPTLPKRGSTDSKAAAMRGVAAALQANQGPSLPLAVPPCRRWEHVRLRSYLQTWCCTVSAPFGLVPAAGSKARPSCCDRHACARGASDRSGV